jgi:pyruvate kinase
MKLFRGLQIAKSSSYHMSAVENRRNIQKHSPIPPPSIHPIDNKSPSIFVNPRRFMKATKQLATLGPASNSVDIIEKLFLSGADVFRLNFSHGEYAEKAELVKKIRMVEEKYNRPIGILADLQV